MKAQKWIISGTLLAVTLLVCFCVPAGRAAVTTSWNYAAKVNDWAIYSLEQNTNETIVPKTYEKNVFTNITKISDTQCLVNMSIYKNKTVSPVSNTLDDWVFNRTDTSLVNNTAVFKFALLLPMDVTLAGTYVQADVEAAMINSYIPGGTYNSTAVVIDGRNATIKVDTAISGAMGTQKTNYTWSGLYNAENLISAAFTFYNTSIYTPADVLMMQMINTIKTTLVETSIKAGGIPAFPVEWIITATAAAVYILARRRMRSTH